MAEQDKKFSTGIKISDFLGEDRPTPHDDVAEKAILAAMLKEPESCVDLAVELLGSSKDFYSLKNRAIYEAITTVYEANNRQVDPIMVAAHLRKLGKLDEIGGTSALLELMESIATTAALEGWCELVRENSILRNLINSCIKAINMCYEEKHEVSDLVEKIESDIFNVRNAHVKEDILTIQETMKETFSNIQKILHGEMEVGIPTHFDYLDKLIVGLKPGEMIVLAARPSIGKTTFALNLLRNIALTESNRPVAFFSLEMTAEQITKKLLCAEANVSESSFYDKSFKPADMTRLTTAISRYQQSNIFIDQTAGLTTSELRTKARRLKAAHNIQAIIIDYLQLMKVSDRIDGRQQEVAEISNTVKKVAKDLEVPVVVLAQLNREVEKTPAGGSTRPKLSNLRESGAIEQDADIVMFLHRDRDKAKDMTEEDLEAGLNTELIVEKNRNGEIGICYLSFHPHLGEFRTTKRFSDDDMPEGGS